MKYKIRRKTTITAKRCPKTTLPTLFVEIFTASGPRHGEKN
jgi:hypothetical protein